MRRVCILAASILATCPVDAAAEWLVLRTEHHQVAGNVSAREMKDVGLRLEQFRIVIILATPHRTARAQAASLAAINFMTFRSLVAGSIICAPPSRADGARTIAVALELLPDGYVP